MALSDIYQKASLVQIPSGYKSGTLYSVVPNTPDGDFTVTGDPEGEATRVNKDGLIETVSANVPRLNYNFIDGVVQPDPHLLLEPTRTNLTTQSEDLSTTWLKSAGVTLTDGQTSPDGSDNAYKVEMTSGANNYLFIGGGTTGVQYTISGYFKADTNTSIGFSDGNTNSNSIDITTEWKRYTFTFTDTGGGVQIDNYFGVSPSQQAKTFYAWGIQMEAGSYATSYIPTSGSAVTRTADTCGDAGNSTIIKAEGGLFVDFTTSNTDNLKRISITDASDANNNIFIQLLGTSFAVQIVSGGTTLYSWGFAITLSDRHKLALRYKDGDSQLYYNGTQQTATTASGTWFTNGLLDTFSLNQGSFFNFYGEIHQAMIFNEALSDSELQTLTT